MASSFPNQLNRLGSSVAPEGSLARDPPASCVTGVVSHCVFCFTQNKIHFSLCTDTKVPVHGTGQCSLSVSYRSTDGAAACGVGWAPPAVGTSQELWHGEVVRFPLLEDNYFGVLMLTLATPYSSTWSLANACGTLSCQKRQVPSVRIWPGRDLGGQCGLVPLARQWSADPRTVGPR